MSTSEASVGRYRISEVARLTGFTATTLRYYESAGVVSPPTRTPAGYRTYDERDVERLRLIARAKDLGCTLEEITGLVEAWDSDECGPVKHQLRALLDSKVDEVRRHIADQTAFAAQLEATAEALAARPVDGPCDSTCGCATPTPPAPPIACALSPTDMASRMADWHAVLRHVAARVDVPGGIRLVFAHDAPLAEISRLAAAEHDCCSFFAFAITVDGRGVALEVTAPADGRALLESVFGDSPPG